MAESAQNQAETEIPRWPGSQHQPGVKNWEEEYTFLKQLLKKAIADIVTRSEWECFYLMELWRFDTELSNLLIAQYWNLLPKQKKERAKRALDRMDGLSFD